MQAIGKRGHKRAQAEQEAQTAFGPGLPVAVAGTFGYNARMQGRAGRRHGMKIATGVIAGKRIILDEPSPLPDRTRVRVVMESLGPDFADDASVPHSQDDVDLVRKTAASRGRITREECG